MTTITLVEPGGRYLSFVEREEIALLRTQNVGVREIARRLGRDASAVRARTAPQCSNSGREATLSGIRRAVEV